MSVPGFFMPLYFCDLLWYTHGNPMQIDYIPLFMFAFITTFTPGPNTISSAVMGLTHGYRRSLPYFWGIASGFFLIMCTSALLSGVLSALLDRWLLLLRIAGSLYILYLAFRIFRSQYVLSEHTGILLGYKEGASLQFLNPKVIILGLTVYSTFLLDMPRTFLTIVLSALAFTLMSFSALTTWSLVGAVISKALKESRPRMVINGLLSLLLVYTAVRLLFS